MKLFSLAFVMTALLIQSAVASEQVCEGAPLRDANSFQFLGDGSQVLDLKTGLIWKRCIEGSNWFNDTCLSEHDILPGHRISYPAAARKAASQSTKTVNWRIPSKAELITLREPKCYNPSINLEVFPASPKWTSDGSFWTASKEASGVSLISAIGGSDSWSRITEREENHLRLVRSPLKGRETKPD